MTQVITAVLTLVVAILIAIGFFSKGYEQGAKESKNTATMQRIQELNGITNMDSAIAKAKQMPSDSLSLIWFDLTATKEERALVKSFALWIKKIKEVKE